MEGITPISPNPVALVRGSIVSGTIDASIDVKQHTFTGQAGDVITLAMTGTAIESGFDAYADVFAPSGALVDQFFGVNRRVITLLEDGLYLIQVHDSNFGQTGRTSLRVDWTTMAASIAGTVYNDANANGARDGEAGLAGRLLYLDANNNGARDATERFTTTDAAGNYTFTALSAGTYLVRQVVPAGWTATNPAGAAQSVTVVAGQNAVGRLFGNTQSPMATASIGGRVFNDANGNGVRDVGELGPALYTIFLDANNDGAQQITEKSVQSDRNGNYSLTGLVAGTYNVRIETIAGVRTTTPSSGKYTVTLTAGQQLLGRDFGELATL